jgi:hypothetical protein
LLGGIFCGCWGQTAKVENDSKKVKIFKRKPDFEKNQEKIPPKTAILLWFSFIIAFHQSKKLG